MNDDIKKDHSIGEGTGAATGAIAGAAIGSAAGPMGSLVGAAVGAVVGAKAGGTVAEAVNPTEYTDYFQTRYENTPYYRSGRTWNDYSPAYQYGYDRYSTYAGRKFDEVENDLAIGWEKTKAESRLAWDEARDAVRDSWHYIERKLPGDADRDGR